MSVWWLLLAPANLTVGGVLIASMLPGTPLVAIMAPLFAAVGWAQAGTG